jgi:hypothetical protein
MEEDQQVLVLFQISNFGWQPCLMTWSVWQEIYEFYEGPESCEICDNNGQTIDVDLCESVKNAIVVKDTTGVDNWIEMTDSEDFFAHICLDPIEDAWTIHTELSCGIARNLAKRDADIDQCKIAGMGTSILSARLKGHNLLFTFSAYLGESYREVRIDGVLNILDGNEPTEKLNKLLDLLQPMIKTDKQINLRPVFADEETNVDVGSFDLFLPKE